MFGAGAEHITNNQITIAGRIENEPEFSHELFGEKFYSIKVMIRRLSENVDYIPVLISEKLIDTKISCKGRYIKVEGQLRSFNEKEDSKSHLKLSVFVRDIYFFKESEKELDCNSIWFQGFICREPLYRETPLGREIADLLVAVNRPYGKSDYIPCVCWGRNARYVTGFEVGDQILIWGRFQSREYNKVISENETEKRIAYEVSVSRIELVEETAKEKENYLEVE